MATQASPTLPSGDLRLWETGINPHWLAGWPGHCLSSGTGTMLPSMLVLLSSLPCSGINKYVGGGTCYWPQSSYWSLHLYKVPYAKSSLNFFLYILPYFLHLQKRASPTASGLSLSRCILPFGSSSGPENSGLPVTTGDCLISGK